MDSPAQGCEGFGGLAIPELTNPPATAKMRGELGQVTLRFGHFAAIGLTSPIQHKAGYGMGSAIMGRATGQDWQ